MKELTVRLCQISQDPSKERKELTEIIKKYKLLTPDLGCIKVLPHRIQLKTNEIVTSKP